MYCVKSVRIRSYSGLHFPAFGLNTDRCGVSLHIQSECGKMWTRTTPNTDTFNAVMCYSKNSLLFQLVTMNIYRKQSLRGGVPWNQLKKENIETLYPLKEPVQIDYKKACSAMEQAWISTFCWHLLKISVTHFTTPVSFYNPWNTSENQR